MNRLKIVALPALVAVVAGCHHRARNPFGQGACTPVDAAAPITFDLEGLPGEYNVTFVATQGVRAGEKVDGKMTLRRQDAGLVRVEHADTTVIVLQPTIGQLDLALDSVGATRMGDPMSANDSMPGVGFYVTQLRGGAVTAVVARVGSGSNARGMMLFDGGYFSLFVKQAGNGLIGGDWRSGAGGMGTPEARGHFCAALVTISH